jgi:hypothetical protein
VNFFADVRGFSLLMNSFPCFLVKNILSAMGAAHDISNSRFMTTRRMIGGVKVHRKNDISHVTRIRDTAEEISFEEQVVFKYALNIL